MLTEDAVVYAHSNGKDYVVCLSDGDWWRWPAEQHGWQQRQRCREALAEHCVEYDAVHARLALRLSGVVA